jgi:hypothetical protein
VAVRFDGEDTFISAAKFVSIYLHCKRFGRLMLQRRQVGENYAAILQGSAERMQRILGDAEFFDVVEVEAVDACSGLRSVRNANVNGVSLAM